MQVAEGQVSQLPESSATESIQIARMHQYRFL
jgi:hypothetical protein